MAEMLAIAAVTAVAAGGTIKTFQAVANDKYQANVARMNQTIAAQNAAFQAQATNTAAEVTGMKAAQQLSGEKAKMAGAGINVGTGSAADTLTSQRQLGAFSYAETMSAGAQRTYGYETQEAGFSAERKMYRNKIPGDLIGGIFDTVGQTAEAGASAGLGQPGAAAGNVGAGIGAGASAYNTSLISQPPSVASGQFNWMGDDAMANYTSQQPWSEFARGAG